MIAQRSDVVKGLSEPQLFNDRLAGRFWHFFTAVIREGASVAVWGDDFEVASFACFEGHPLGLQPSSELAELQPLAWFVILGSMMAAASGLSLWLV